MPREVILHIGQPKTGTTSLQRRLAQQRDRLLQNNILYPTVAGSDFNHRCLSPAISGVKNFPADIRLGLGGSGEQIVERSKAQWKRLRKTFDQDMLILSGESFFQPLDARAVSRLKWFLSMGERYPYRVLSYIRNPSERYLSFVQEQLKLVNRIMALKAYPFMNVLMSYQRTFGADFHVRLYDRNLLKGADVLCDFADWLNVDSGAIDTELETEKPNHSLSAEAMSILTRLEGRYRKKTKGEILQNRKKINALRRLDRNIPGETKPVLTQDAKAFIERNSPELLLLRDVFGLAFPDVDYASIQPGQESEKMPVTDFSQICAFDPDRCELLAEGMRTKFTPEELKLAP